MGEEQLPLIRKPFRSGLMRHLVLLSAGLVYIVLSWLFGPIDLSGWLHLVIALLLLPYEVYEFVKFLYFRGLYVRSVGDTVEVVRYWRWVPVGKRGEVVLNANGPYPRLRPIKLVSDAGVFSVTTGDLEKLSTEHLTDFVQVAPSGVG